MHIAVFKEDMCVMFVVIVHSLSHNSLGAEGAEFLCSVLPSLPNLTSLRWEIFHIVTLLLLPALKF